MNTVCLRGSFPQEGTREIVLRTHTFTALFPARHRRGNDIRHSLLGGAGVGEKLGKAEEPVEHARVVDLRDPYSGFPQPDGVRVALVTEGIEARGHDLGGRQTVRIGQEGRGVRVRAVALGTEVLLGEPPAVRRREEYAGPPVEGAPSPGRASVAG